MTVFGYSISDAAFGWLGFALISGTLMAALAVGRVSFGAGPTYDRSAEPRRYWSIILLLGLLDAGMLATALR